MTKEAGLKILSMFVILLMTFSVDSEVRTGLERYFPTITMSSAYAGLLPFG
jgi:hypothetical protein